MYFKKLELVGFKSFCNKTTLNFEPGVTAVVGPNGCGKSNIFDSIRWVLGEQSAKSLRGSDMQDVIFNGTDAKEPLSMAEVTLIFDNQQKFFPLDHEEVAISRRIYRSGESEYLLNKTPVRLKDILDILMGTGIGAESYSLVAQGKIDLILSSRPEDRRLVFDEAAGITKYKSQKREAMRKLEETSQNLLRVNDIITEVKRQIGSLERQANKARRYKEVFEEVRGKELTLGSQQRQRMLAEIEQTAQKLKNLGDREHCLLENIKEQETKIGSRQEELRLIEDSIIDIRNEILSLENSKKTSREYIEFNKKRLVELEAGSLRLAEQLEQTKTRMFQDEEKLNTVKAEQETVQKTIEEKQEKLREKEAELSSLTLAIKSSLDNITNAKKNILEMAIKLSGLRNRISDASSKEQVCLARQKRLELEKLKVNEEKQGVENSLNALIQEITDAENALAEINKAISSSSSESAQESLSLEEIKKTIESLERESLALKSQKEFLEELKSKYDNIGECMNAVIQLDKLPAQEISGLVIKIRNIEAAQLKAYGEAKPIDLDTQKIAALIARIEEKIIGLQGTKTEKETRIGEIKLSLAKLEEDLRGREIVLANKRAGRDGVTAQLNKIKGEEELIELELTDVSEEISGFSAILAQGQADLIGLENQQKQFDETILREQAELAARGALKEQATVAIAEIKTECDGMIKRASSDEATLKMLEDAFLQDQQRYAEIENQIAEEKRQKENLNGQIADLEKKIIQAEEEARGKNTLLLETEVNSRNLAAGLTGIAQNIEANRRELDSVKNTLYELQMRNREIEFSIQSIHDKLMQAYKIDLSALEEPRQPGEEALPQADEGMLAEEIKKLKDKLDSYGSVNLVAIEEYDELKKRYDFLTQQHEDLDNGKESLHQAILKINRTTKEMFMQTFIQIREEFRNYFRLLFNGGDAQVFLIDEQDPLESGIEIICRPPGKKLQNVLLLSGGEKSMSAIALIFAIFKVKPSPFCVLDEIDAALDEANVDRFGKILQEFVKTSQFIVITHNKKTIANADVMYGITMEQSGVSKIVSVKFTRQQTKQSSEPDGMAAVEAG